jgi:polyhydroxybutyrate depolymerase
MKRCHLGGVTILLALAGLVPSALLAQSEQATHVIMVQVGDAYRSVQLHIPAGHDGETPLPLVFNLHGTGGSAERQELLTGMSAVADEERFLVAGGMAKYIFPDGRMAGNVTWNVNLVPDEVNDVDYVLAAIDAVDRKVPVNRKRVYVTGFSGGGRMSSRLACELSDRVAAVAPVSGVQFPDDCQPVRQIPLITFHGVMDPLNTYHGAADPERNSSWVMGVESAVANWAGNNGCGGQAIADKITDEITRFSYRNCTDGADVTLYRIGNGGHNWPGSPTAALRPARAGITNMDINASRVIWKFFELHPLP